MPSPYEPPQLHATPDVQDVTNAVTPAFDVANERDYFQAPSQTSKPAPATRAVPCTTQLIVFDKTQLAQACY
jgi:hypothetical protein